MASTMMLKLTGYGIGAILAERLLAGGLPGGITAAATLTVPKLYGLVAITNCVLPSFTMLYLGFGIVSPAREKYGVKLPTMYAVSTKEGDDAHKFNCCQRAHQNALETFSIFLAASMIGGIKHPIVTACCGILWCYSRVVWAQGYATGVPANRYSAAIAKHIWTAIWIPLMCSVSAGLSLAGII